jgi:ankyrin repeat protein
MLDFLLARGTAIDVRSTEGATALLTESQAEKPRHVAWLLERGADPNARDRRGFTALHRAAERGHREVVDLLLAKGADPRVEAEGHTPRSLAEGRGHAEIVRRLSPTA